MINFNGLENACTELFKRTGISIEIQDNNSTVVYKSNVRQEITLSDNCASTVPRSNKNLAVLPGRWRCSLYPHI